MKNKYLEFSTTMVINKMTIQQNHCLTSYEKGE